MDSTEFSASPTCGLPEQTFSSELHHSPCVRVHPLFSSRISKICWRTPHFNPAKERMPVTTPGNWSTKVCIVPAKHMDAPEMAAASVSFREMSPAVPME